ncbi:CHAP domain-containing protein [Staphylococcus xylosus]|uniref:CHAP domain-containing protein n=1 Tax=Staphylococcus xylosus TaxID=1288 RepID=UPI002DC039DC|nr:CHAP domain-containing protein [Staphylococcus xylosus]MEB6240623.1 CHAP domain-containing protein [Staphylococcus xylosus]
MVNAVMTKNEFLVWLNNSIGKQYDFDGWYGFQCYDYANAGWAQLFPGTSLQGDYAKDIHTDNQALLKERAKVYKNTLDFLALPGDMVIFPYTYGDGAGHVGFVVSADLNQLTIVEQNWLGGGWTEGPEQGGTGWEKVAQRVHPYDPNMYFVRPNFKAAEKITWNWSGRFTANTTIKVRRSAGLKGEVVDSGSWIYANEWVDFGSITKKDGYWWIKFKYPTNPSAGYFYLAVCKITDKDEKIKNEKYLGSINWS